MVIRRRPQSFWIQKRTPNTFFGRIEIDVQKTPTEEEEEVVVVVVVLVLPNVFDSFLQCFSYEFYVYTMYTPFPVPLSFSEARGWSC